VTVKNNNPYEETQLCPRSFARIFSKDDSDEFVWHRDREDRVVSSDSDWLVQLDGKLPEPMTRPVWIPVGMYHRVIPGKQETAEIKVIMI
jgi:hypothetical protein